MEELSDRETAGRSPTCDWAAVPSPVRRWRCSHRLLAWVRGRWYRCRGRSSREAVRRQGRIGDGRGDRHWGWRVVARRRFGVDGRGDRTESEADGGVVGWRRLVRGRRVELLRRRRRRRVGCRVGRIPRVVGPRMALRAGRVGVLVAESVLREGRVQRLPAPRRRRRRPSRLRGRCRSLLSTSPSGGSGGGEGDLSEARLAGGDARRGERRTKKRSEAFSDGVGDPTRQVECDLKTQHKIDRSAKCGEYGSSKERTHVVRKPSTLDLEVSSPNLLEQGADLRLHLDKTDHVGCAQRTGKGQMPVGRVDEKRVETHPWSCRAASRCSSSGLSRFHCRS